MRWKSCFCGVFCAAVVALVVGSYACLFGWRPPAAWDLEGLFAATILLAVLAGAGWVVAREMED